MMRDAILNFPKQFLFTPKFENGKKLKKFSSYILLGMGGSHLAADLALAAAPDLPLTIHSDYGLPAIHPRLSKLTLIIASSYSGNTEEVVDGLTQARKKKLPVVCIAVGGKLIELAKKYRLPYIQLPDTGIQPRSALGFGLRALLLVLGEATALRQTKMLSRTLQPLSLEKAGAALAKRLENSIPVIYCSRANAAIAYNWKIKFNETGKIPAFCNVLPELNHNEMTGFDVKPSSRQLSEHCYFIFLADKQDHPRNQKRMDILERLYRDRQLRVEVIPLEGATAYEKIFTSLLLADWTAVHAAEQYGLESEQVPMVEEFKRLMK